MPKPKLSYAIDDDLTVEDNLLALGAAIETLDPALAGIVAPYLETWAADEAVNTEALWSALYDAAGGEQL